MIPNNNLSVLPWYTSIERQNARKWWVYDKVYPLFTPATFMLPFQILRKHISGTSISYFKIYTKDNLFVGDFTTEIQRGLRVRPFAAYDYDVIVYPGLLPVCSEMDNGQYYAVLSDGTNVWYSEMFTVVNDISPYLKIQWWDVDDFVLDSGRILYQNPPFKNVLYLPSDIAKPEYVFEDEAVDRDGYTFTTKQISKKVYHFGFFASEYLLDVMRFIRMADYVRIDYNGQKFDKIDSFLLTPEWEDNGDVASVDAEFSTLTVAKKIGRAYAVQGGDFNSDFNNDFDIQ